MQQTGHLQIHTGGLFKKMPGQLTYFLEEEHKIADHILRWFSLIAGYDLKKLSGGAADIYYGNNPVNCRISIRKNPGDILWQELIKGNYEAHTGTNIDFDIINAVTCFIGDSVNSNHP